MTKGQNPVLIGLDWGTTSLRAYCVSASGEVVATAHSAAGILAEHADGFHGTFREIAGEWLQEFGPLPVLASGMITSRNGWIETPYLSAPAALDQFADSLTGYEAGDGVAMYFVPGLSCLDSLGNPDIARGEETQIIGALTHPQAGGANDRLFLLPGTHSKWARVGSEKIHKFETYMTGEVFAVLLNHSILSKLAEPQTSGSTDVFSKAVEQGLESRSSVLHTIFGARTLALFESLKGQDVPDYLSGALIAEEIKAATATLGADDFGKVTVIGRSDLAEKYALALKIAGIDTEFAPPDMAAHGHYSLAMAKGLV